MTYDLACPGVTGLLFASVIFLAFAKKRFRYVVIAPLLAALFDYVENVFFYNFLQDQPDISEHSVRIANIISLAKFGLSWIAAAIVVAALAYLIYGWIERTVGLGA